MAEDFSKLMKSRVDDSCPALRSSSRARGIDLDPLSLAVYVSLKQMNKNQVLRRRLRKELRADSSFEAFCLDYFPNIKRLFAAGMSREEKENILIERIDGETIAQQMEEHKATEANHLLSDRDGTDDIEWQIKRNQLGAMRTWLIRTSLVIVALNLAFFFLAPSCGYPIEHTQSIRMAQMILPVFLGYVGTATVSMVDGSAIRLNRRLDHGLLSTLVYGPVIVFIVIALLSIIVYGYTNSFLDTPGSGMSPNTLAMALSISISILNISTNSVIYFLFDSNRY